MKSFTCIVITILLSYSVSRAAEYWVSTNGLNSNPGSQESPWLTVTKAASVAHAGDLIHVTAGIYDEKVTPTYSGTSGSYIVYKGDGYPVIRGFDFTGKSYWAVIGFHFYHPSTNYYYDAISINRCNYFSILDNYFETINSIHAVISCGTSFSSAPNYSSYGLIRSNLFCRAGLVPGSSMVPTSNIIINGTNNLIEYNDINQSDDMIRLFGQYNVIRNNYYHDIDYKYFSNTPHSDFMQTYDSPGIYSNFNHNILECNMIVSNCNANGHIYILQNASTNYSTYSISDLVVRKNVALYTGGAIGLVDDVPNVRDYNNTWAYVGGAVSGSTINDFCTLATTNYIKKGVIQPTNFVGINSIYVQASHPTVGTIFGAIGEGVLNSNAPMYSVIKNNLTHQSGPSIPKSYGPDIINIDPQFVSSRDFDYHLASGSRAIGFACAQTVTLSKGLSTNVVLVKDAGFYTDGWGIPDVNGDVVDIGTNTKVKITHIDYAQNSLTLNSNISWNTGDGVFLTGTRDLGAFEYSAAGYDYGVSLVYPTNGAIVKGLTTISARVTNPSVVRIVRFYVDGLEVTNAVPSSFVSVNVPLPASSRVVQVRAYALYADSKLAVVDSSLIYNSNIAPPPNFGLQGDQ